MLDIRKIGFEQTYRIRHEVMWPNKPLDYIKLDADSEGLHFGAFHKNELVSVISLFIDVEHASAQFRKFATLEAYQGRGIGSKLLAYVMNESKERGVKRLWCNARLDATRLYEHHGLKKTDQTFEKGGQSYVIMELFL